jgi:hypothetical protein
MGGVSIGVKYNRELGSTFSKMWIENISNTLLKTLLSSIQHGSILPFNDQEFFV